MKSFRAERQFSRVVLPSSLTKLVARRLDALPGSLAWELYDPFPTLLPPSFIGHDSSWVPRVMAMELDELSVCWRLPPNNVRPGHGLLMLPHIRPSLNLCVDVGCGPLALHGVFARARHAGSVVCLDNDPVIVREARDAVRGLSGIKVIQSDLLAALGDQSIHYATFHPPMLPDDPSARSYLQNEELSYHFGGRTGRSVLDRGLRMIADRLVPGGRLVLGQFEFLGVDRPFGRANRSTTSELASTHDLLVEEAHYYRVQMSSALRNARKAIRSLYPDYPFEEANGAVFHRFVVLVLRKRIGTTALAI